MRTSMTGIATKTYEIKLNYDDIMDMFKSGGYEFSDSPKVDVFRGASNSAIEAKLGDVKLPIQSLHLVVTVTEKIEE